MNDELIFNLFIMEFSNKKTRSMKESGYYYNTRSSMNFKTIKKCFPINEVCGDFALDMVISIENDTTAILRQNKTANYIKD